jgi:hypothetical protein
MLILVERERERERENEFLQKFTTGGQLKAAFLKILQNQM